MNHDHPDPARLTFGCPCCVEMVKRDEYLAALPTKTMDELVEDLMGREHILNDWKCAALTDEIARRERAAS